MYTYRNNFFTDSVTDAFQPVSCRHCLKTTVCTICNVSCSLPRWCLTLLFSLALQTPWALASDFQFHDHFTDRRTPWTSDQLVIRPLSVHRTTQTQNKHIHTPNIHALCSIRTHDPGFRASEDSACLRPLGYGNRINSYILGITKR
jgi:hypothetical protein